MTPPAPNGTKVWSFLQWSLGIMAVGLISLSNVVYSNHGNIRDNASVIKSNQEITKIKLAYIQDSIDEIKELVKKP